LNSSASEVEFPHLEHGEMSMVAYASRFEYLARLYVQVVL